MSSVIHILSSLKLGGAERVTVALAKAQMDQGLNVKIYSLGSQDDFLVEEVSSNRIPLQVSEPGQSRISKYADFVRATRDYDVIHIHSPRSLAHLTAIIPFITKKKIVYTRHGLDPLDSIKWRFVHLAWKRHIDAVTFVTQAGYDVFVKTHKWEEEKLSVITNGASVPEVKAKVIELPIKFGSVGRMVDLKRQDMLLDAVDLLVRKGFGSSDFSIQFYGSGPLENELRTKSQKLDLAMVEFHGEVNDIDEIYDNIDVLVVSSESEGLSMVILEAMARSVPVIATDVGGNSSLVKNESTGYLVPFGEPSPIYESMVKFLEQPESVASLGAEARQLIVSSFSINATCKQYYECYQRE